MNAARGQAGKRLRLTLPLAVAVAACGPTTLEGSLTQLYDLLYTRARVQLSPEDLAVAFVKDRKSSLTLADGGTASAGEDLVFIVAVAIRDADGGLPVGREIDLTEADAAGNQRGVYSRNVVGDPRTTFPKAKIAGMTLNRTPVEGRPLSGSFHVTFEDGIEAASGRTVFGPFDVKEVQ